MKKILTKFLTDVEQGVAGAAAACLYLQPDMGPFLFTRADSTVSLAPLCFSSEGMFELFLSN